MSTPSGEQHADSNFDLVVQGVPRDGTLRLSVCCDLVKVIVSLDAESFGVWEKDNFAPEGAFLAALEAIEGISNVETQTFTLMPL